METLILVVHVLAAVLIIALVLLQQGKGADAGASFGGGGASQTVFGSQGNSSFFGRMTAVFALVFFLTSFGLAFFASEQAKSISGVQDYVPSAPQVDESVDLPGLSVQQTTSDLPVTE
jgi:preprotein translocase subunit SecG